LNSRILSSIRLVLLAGILAASPGVLAEVLLGRVVAIADGDTLTVLDAANTQHRIRIQGTDAPEKAQPFGQRSRQNLGALAFGKEARVEWDKKDRYRRIVGKVLVEPPDAPCRGKPDCPTTLDVGLAQIQAGLAWWYRKYAKEQSPEDQRRYEQAEFEAKIRRSGLWSEKNPMPPWEWRHRE
jgi:endonuclease YncB( thermonuclease family)